MTHLAPRLAAMLIALALTVSGVALGAGSGPTLSHPIAPFGCYT